MINKKILIIGGTGALGQALTKKYLKDNEIIIFSRDEHKHVELSRKLPDVKFHIGDVKDKDSMLQVLNEYTPHVVIHTAAMKHVPVCEDNPYESVKVNIIGHKNLIDAVSLSRHKIETLMFISTDKACKPMNVYGMCKAISERLYVDFANKQNDMKVVLCRYGNVLESTGSVIPFFKELLDRGEKELPITDKRMTRFLLSLDEAVDLIDWSYENESSHGSIVVPKLKSLKITHLAEELIKHYGKSDDVKLNYVGIRAGEKLYEEMISPEESFRTIECGDYYMITDNLINKNGVDYSSSEVIMNQSEIHDFLIKKGVLSD
jgi:UDP-N-acetylglucosamine 4,6-dehydratase